MSLKPVTPNRRFLGCWRWLALIACAVPLVAPGQKTTANAQPDNSTLTLTVNARLVVLDAIVTDAAGNVVTDLKEDDFTVLENGVQQHIRNFEAPSSRPALAASGPVAVDSLGKPDWGEASLNIFVLDDLNTPFDEKAYSAIMLKKYLLAQPETLAGPAELLVVNDFGYKSLQSFTRSREQLIKAIDARPPSVPSLLTRGATDDLLRKSLAMLRQISLSNEGSKQHKNLIWLGRGFPSLDPTSFSSKQQDALQAIIRDTSTSLMNARITVFKVDPMATTTAVTTLDPAATLEIGAGAGGDDEDILQLEDPLEDNFNFNTFAAQTGGKYFYGQNDLNRFIRNAVDDGGQSYTLSYVPSDKSGEEGQYRAITVKLDKPGLKIATRNGYYLQPATKPQPTLKQLGFDLGEAVVGHMDYTSIEASISSAVLNKAKSSVDITFRVKEQDLAWSAVPAGGQTATLTVLMAGIDAKGHMVTSSAYELHPYLPPGKDSEIGTGAVTVRDGLELSSKVTAIRVVVYDSSGRIGTADVDGPTMAAIKTGHAR